MAMGKGWQVEMQHRLTGMCLDGAGQWSSKQLTGCNVLQLVRLVRVALAFVLPMQKNTANSYSTSAMSVGVYSLLVKTLLGSYKSWVPVHISLLGISLALLHPTFPALCHSHHPCSQLLDHWKQISTLSHCLVRSWGSLHTFTEIQCSGHVEHDNFTWLCPVGKQHLMIEFLNAALQEQNKAPYQPT